MRIPASTQEVHLTAALAKKGPLSLALTGRETKVIVRVERGVTGIVFDTTSSSTHSIHVELLEESSLSYISCSKDSSRQCTSIIGAGASIHWHCITLGTSEPHTLTSTLQGRDAVSNVDWIFSVHGKEEQELSVRNIFAAANGGGEITLKGVAEDTAYASANGMIEITERGQGTNTYLTEDVLMLDPSAKIDAVPGLEIRTNDVKASHSATVSRVTPENLFYFQSRGISEKLARRMYVEGFLRSLTERIPDASVRAEVEERLTIH